MSEPEQEQEPQEGAETPQEPLQGDELAPDEEEAEEAETAEEQAQEPPEEEAPAGMSEKQLEAGRKKLEAEGTRHRNRISEIIGEEANSLVTCPLCAGFIDGLIFPVLPPDDVIAATRVAIGMPDLSNYQQAKHARQCDDCLGLGVVLSGSLVNGNVAIDCVTCGASGYVVLLEHTGELVAPATPNGQPQAALPAGVNENDPAVKSLRERGYSVFPPPPVLTGPTAQ